MSHPMTDEMKRLVSVTALEAAENIVSMIEAEARQKGIPLNEGAIEKTKNQFADVIESTCHVEALTGENEKLREALKVAREAFKRIDQLAYGHARGAMPKAQGIARAALNDLQRGGEQEGKEGA